MVHDQTKAEVVARLRSDPREVTPGQKYEVRNYTRQDGDGVVRTILSVYGDKYPVDDFYVPDRLWQLNDSGDMLTVVAKTPDGEIVGHASLWRTSSPNIHLYEFGQMIVIQSYRRRAIALRLTQHILRQIQTTAAVHGFFGETVTNHATTQKIASMMGAVPCALELALMPDGQFSGEGAGTSRVSCLLMAKVIHSVRQTLHLPVSYRSVLTHLIASLDIDRDVYFSDGTEPQSEFTAMEVQNFGSAGVIRCHVRVPGRDFSDRVRLLLRDGHPVMEVFLNASELAAPWAVSELRRAGFFLSGLVPLWFGTDALLMERVVSDVDINSIHLWSDSVKPLTDFVFADFRRTIDADR